jgi:hypothetical protein
MDFGYVAIVDCKIGQQQPFCFNLNFIDFPCQILDHKKTTYYFFPSKQSAERKKNGMGFYRCFL